MTFTEDGLIGWAVGQGGTVIKTEDGGKTWEPRESGTSEWLNSVAFAGDGRNGWIVAPGTILFTNDGDGWTPEWIIGNTRRRGLG